MNLECLTHVFAVYEFVPEAPYVIVIVVVSFELDYYDEYPVVAVTQYILVILCKIEKNS